MASRRTEPNRSFPDHDNHFGQLFSRENYWSPCSQHEMPDNRRWEEIENTVIKVVPTANDSAGELSGDASGAPLHRPYALQEDVHRNGVTVC